MQSRANQIEPAVMRLVLVRGSAVLKDDPKREMPAVITRVWSQNTIDVHVFGSVGSVFQSSVQYDEDVEKEVPGISWRWNAHQMQVGQAQGRGQIGAPPPIVEFTFLDRLKLEHSTLEDRRNKLCLFMAGLNFQDLPGPQRELLIAQNEAMVLYSDILVRRLKLLEA